MENEKTLSYLRESLDRFEHLVRTQANYIAELERGRDIPVADLDAMMARRPDPNNSVIDLVNTPLYRVPATSGQCTYPDQQSLAAPPLSAKRVN